MFECDCASMAFFSSSFFRKQVLFEEGDNWERLILSSVASFLILHTLI